MLCLALSQCRNRFLSAFLLGNGQTYATRGVPYYRVSRIFMTSNFHPCKLVPQIHVSHFPPLQHGAAFSCPAISCLAFSASPIGADLRLLLQNVKGLTFLGHTGIFTTIQQKIHNNSTATSCRINPPPTNRGSGVWA